MAGKGHSFHFLVRKHFLPFEEMREWCVQMANIKGFSKLQSCVLIQIV